MGLLIIIVFKYILDIVQFLWKLNLMLKIPLIQGLIFYNLVLWDCLWGIQITQNPKVSGACGPNPQWGAYSAPHTPSC